MGELSVLEYIHLKIKPENWHRDILPETDPVSEERRSFPSDGLKNRGFLFLLAEKIQQVSTLGKNEVTAFPIWLVILILITAIFGQSLLDPQIHRGIRTPNPSLIFYGICVVLIVFGTIFSLKRHSQTDSLFKTIKKEQPEACSAGFDLNFKPLSLALSLGFAVAAFLLFSSNRFTLLNTLLWLLSIGFALAAFCHKDGVADIIQRVKSAWRALTRRGIRLDGFALLWILVFLVSVFFRLYRLDSVPFDMFSDHAEKLLDVDDLLNGKTAIFFTRNTGREAFQFYWTALIARLFGTGTSFLSLKIGTALAGIVALPFIYLIGKKVFNRHVGLLAMGLCGIAYWPNVIDRVALRFAFYPMFTAPAFYYLLSGLEDRKIKHLILSGILLGLGLQGYSAMRIVPLAFVLFFISYLLAVKPFLRKEAFAGFGILVYFTILAVLPLLRVLTVMPANVLYRSMTRLSGVETELSANPLQVLLDNLWKALIMPFWDNGRIWVHSIPFRPALDIFTAAFFAIGLVFLIIRIIRRRFWMDSVLLISIPLFMLPSVLSIAFPDENPSLNRTGAAMIPIFCIAAYGFWVLIRMMLDRTGNKPVQTVIIGLMAGMLFTASAVLNYRLTFDTYQKNYAQNAWNTREMGDVIRGYSVSVGEIASAFVMPYPHWVDTRLVGITAGYVKRDTALDHSLVPSLVEVTRPLLFLYKPDDVEAEMLLESTFPSGLKKLHPNEIPGRDFYSYLVP